MIASHLHGYWHCARHIEHWQQRRAHHRTYTYPRSKCLDPRPASRLPASWQLEHVTYCPSTLSTRPLPVLRSYFSSDGSPV